MLKDLITRKVVSVEPNTKLSEVARVMSNEDIGSVLITSNRKPKGIVTDRDIVLRCIAKNIDVNDCTVENVMTESIHTCRETDGLFDCIRKMNQAGIRRIPVVDSNGNAVGLVSFGDIVGFLGKEFYDLTRTTTKSQEFEERAAA